MRLSVAQIELKEYDEALKTIDHCWELEPNNMEIFEQRQAII